MSAVNASSSDGERVSTRDVLHKQATAALSVPYAEISTMEGIVTGFRQRMLALGEDGELGSVDSGAGLGSDFITLNWGERTAVVRGIDLLRAWVATFDPEAAKRFPDGLKP